MYKINLPPQKKKFRSKNKDWREDCIRAIDSGVSYLKNEEVRRSVIEKTINGELYDGILNMRDVMEIVNTDAVLNAYLPDKIQHRPIMRSKIELLVGEASKEPFDWNVIVTDPNSIAMKEEYKKEAINAKIMELLESEYEGDELKMKLKDLDLYFRYTWKDLKEVRATKILKHYSRFLKLESKFNECMLDRLIYGEQAILWDIVSKEPVAFKLDPKKVHTVYSSQSNKMSDADVIVIEDYWSPGKLIDNYYEDLTSEEVSRIEEGLVTGHDHNRAYQHQVSPEGVILDSMVVAAGLNRPYAINGDTIDPDGNIRHLKALWRSMQYLKLVEGIDPTTGETYEKVMSEDYTPNPLFAEKIVKRVWVEQWWEGTKIGSDMYKRIRPRQIQYRTGSNLSKGHPGIVGFTNSISGGKVVSFLSKMKPYQYLYDITWDRLMDSLKKNLGKIMEVDLAKIPRGWTVEKWMYYAFKGGIAFVDSFKEATKGVATGKLAGTFNTTGKILNAETGNYIQQHVNLLQYIKSEMSDMVGVTPQREGAIAPSAKVGTTERSVIQSNNSTAYEFNQHLEFKLENLTIGLETAKAALRGNKVKQQHILDDFTSEIFSIDGDELAESDYSVFVTVSKKAEEMQKSLDAYSQAFMQNGGNFSTVLDILFSDSLAEKRRKIELAEFDMKEEARQQQSQAAQLQQENLEAQAAAKQKDIDLKMYEIDSNNATKIILKEMDQETADKELEQQGEEKKEDILMRIRELQAQINKTRTEKAA